MNIRIIKVLSLLPSSLLLATSSFAATAPTSIAKLYEESFLVGTAIKSGDLKNPPALSSSLSCREFNAFTAENAMKWEHIHPKPDAYDFSMSDQLIKMAEQCDAKVIGHTLVWHQQTPAWVFQDSQGNTLGRDALLARLKGHIETVVGRYKGKVYGWDVVNEALDEEGNLRDSPWRKIIGDDYLIHAFRYAKAADPTAQLYYNDFNLYKKEKVAGAIKLVEQLRNVGERVDAIGMQGHYSLFYPSLSEIEQSMQAIIDAGIDIAITELDVSVLPLPDDAFSGAEITQSFAAHPVYDPYTTGLPEQQQRQLAETYQGLFGLFLKYAGNVNRVTFWGSSDADSWRNNWPIRGRTDYPLIFDRAGQPKLAHQYITQAIN